jgi:NAD(P)H-dependent flavin oxidoreductase YrpB (nitropropane dioxygenase family)
MAAAGLSALAAAVSEAGGLGTIGLAGFTPEGIHIVKAFFARFSVNALRLTRKE